MIEQQRDIRPTELDFILLFMPGTCVLQAMLLFTLAPLHMLPPEEGKMLLFSAIVTVPLSFMSLLIAFARLVSGSWNRPRRSACGIALVLGIVGTGVMAYVFLGVVFFSPFRGSIG